MVNIMPQQRLLLELLTMSGELGVTGAPDGSMLWRTLKECQQARWLKLTEITPDIHKALELTPSQGSQGSKITS